MKRSMAAMLTLLACTAQAADVEAGRARATAVCAACHGATGISVGDSIPNLAGQRAPYLASQLRAFKDGSRKSAVMSAIATQLSAEEIAGLAAYFSAQAGAPAGAKSEPLAALAAARVVFPDGYRERFTRYHTISFPATKQVRHYFANAVAVQAARDGRTLPDGSAVIAEVYAARLDADGKPVLGNDGYFVADRLLAYSAMAREAGWGAEVPDMLRNGNWSYAAFNAERQPRSINQAECLACHKPLEASSYLFTLKELATAR